MSTSDQLLPSSFKSIHLQAISSLHKLLWQTSMSDKQTLRGEGRHAVFFIPLKTVPVTFFHYQFAEGVLLYFGSMQK